MIGYRARMPVAVVTDSTAYLPAELGGTYDLTVVPPPAVVNGAAGLEGIEITPAEVARRASAVAGLWTSDRGRTDAPPGSPTRLALEELAEAPVTTLPFLFAPELGREEIRELAEGVI